MTRNPFFKFAIAAAAALLGAGSQSFGMVETALTEDPGSQINLNGHWYTTGNGHGSGGARARRRWKQRRAAGNEGRHR